MPQLDLAFVILLLLAIVCYLTNNYTVALAVLLLFVFKLTPLSRYFSLLHHHGITAGIVILTAAMLVPLVNGSVSATVLLKSLTHWQSLLAIFVGVFVSWAGMRGLVLIESSPVIVNGLIIGTLIGVAFLKGVPVGPLIAAGLLSIIIGRF